MCGDMMTFGMSQSGLSAGSGSTSFTSRPAPAIRPSCSAAISAGFVDDLAAGDIDDVGRRLHGGDLGRADQVEARLVAGGADHHRVGLRERLAHALARKYRRRVRRRPPSSRDTAITRASKAFSLRTSLAADGAAADHADRRVFERAELRRWSPRACSDAPR